MNYYLIAIVSLNFLIVSWLMAASLIGDGFDSIVGMIGIVFFGWVFFKSLEEAKGK